jgi:hypothetical protein
VPLAARLDGYPDPATGSYESHRFQYANRLSGHRAGHPVLAADAVECEYLTGAVMAGHDLGAHPGENAAMKFACARVCRHRHIFSLPSLGANEMP